MPFELQRTLCSVADVALSRIIIQQIVTLSKYGHDALDIRHP